MKRLPDGFSAIYNLSTFVGDILSQIELNPRKSLNKAFLKVKPNRIGNESLKKNLIYLIDNINEREDHADP
jgi:hypothetical protein